MGHYCSEMVSDSEAERKAGENAERHAKRVAKIQAAIDEKGIADVLAELAEDDVMFRIRYR